MQLLEYIYVLLNSGPLMFCMPDITISISSPTPGPSVGLGGTIAPYLAHIFGTGHISSSTLFEEDFHSLHLVLTLVFIPMGVIMDTWMLGLQLTFLLMSHCPPHCFL